MRYFSFSIHEDQAANITSGFVEIEKTSANVNIWQHLRRGDSVFIAPISVPFKVYLLKVATTGILANTTFREHNGLLIYFDTVFENTNVRTNLYNLQVF